MYNANWSGDRRRFQRLNINLAAWYKVVNAEDNLSDRETEVTLLDLSQGGMAFLTRQCIPERTKISVKFVLFKVDSQGYIKFHGPLTLGGEVCSSKPSENSRFYRLGVAFKEICKDDECRIADFVGSTFMIP